MHMLDAYMHQSIFSETKVESGYYTIIFCIERNRKRADRKDLRLKPSIIYT